MTAESKFPRHPVSGEFYPAELRDKLGSKIWISEDVPVIGDIEIEGNSTAWVPIMLSDLPEPLKSLPINPTTQRYFNFLEASTRSRFQQIGLEVDEHAGEAISLTFGSGEFDERVLVRNHIPHPIHVPNGTSLLRLYMFDRSQAVVGDELREMMAKGDIGLESDVPNVWDFKYRDGNTKEPVGITLMLDPSFIKKVKPNGTAPIEIHEPSEGNFRTAVDKLLEDAPKSSSPSYWIGETSARLNLSLNVHALIDTPEHRNSRLLYGGRTNWPIRTEIVSPVRTTQMTRKIDLIFAKAA